MKLPNIAIDWKITLGQLVSAVVFIVTIAVGVGVTVQRLDAVETAVTNMNDAAKTHVTREELKGYLEGISVNTFEMQQDIDILTQAVLQNVPFTESLASKAKRARATANSRQRYFPYPDSSNTNAPH